MRSGKSSEAIHIHGNQGAFCQSSAAASLTVFTKKIGAPSFLRDLSGAGAAASHEAPQEPSHSGQMSPRLAPRFDSSGTYPLRTNVLNG
jgi:hypothetical protein